ncbi:unnamed protein product, partial [marine sediment metagenome]
FDCGCALVRALYAEDGVMDKEYVMYPGENGPVIDWEATCKEGDEEIETLRSELQIAKKIAWNDALSAARVECMKNAHRPHPDAPDAVGARNCIEISEAIFELREE